MSSPPPGSAFTERLLYPNMCAKGISLVLYLIKLVTDRADHSIRKPHAAAELYGGMRLDTGSMSR